MQVPRQTDASYSKWASRMSHGPTVMVHGDEQDERGGFLLMPLPSYDKVGVLTKDRTIEAVDESLHMAVKLQVHD